MKQLCKDTFMCLNFRTITSCIGTYLSRISLLVPTFSNIIACLQCEFPTRMSLPSVPQLSENHKPVLYSVGASWPVVEMRNVKTPFLSSAVY